MKLVLGIILVLVGGLIFIIGSVVCVTTWTSDYASAACERAAHDEEAFREARERCGDTTSDCYKQATIGLTTPEDCESKTAFMRNQLIVGVVVAVVGGFVTFVGLIVTIFGFIGRRKKAVV